MRLYCFCWDESNLIRDRYPHPEFSHCACAPPPPAKTSGSGLRNRTVATMEEPEMQLKGKKVTDKFTESVYVLANEPSVALYRLQEHVRRSLPELAQHKADMQRWEEQSQGAIYTVEYACRCLGQASSWFSEAPTICHRKGS
ncbi:BLOC-1-related complex subunit 8 isoform X2 [Moschus berezovskii]|uniref:BLOC-1-related complex subunit 8 isoform X2 n=1 Tax=Moschus berezovskii TaxID=68408 RepID=UPI002443BBF2|nr:BLOC-1-related complex subunit 8 isoform X2 [Moschus berezovskii]